MPRIRHAGCGGRGLLVPIRTVRSASHPAPSSLSPSHPASIPSVPDPIPSCPLLPRTHPAYPPPHPILPPPDCPHSAHPCPHPECLHPILLPSRVSLTLSLCCLSPCCPLLPRTHPDCPHPAHPCLHSACPLLRLPPWTPPACCLSLFPSHPACPFLPVPILPWTHSAHPCPPYPLLSVSILPNLILPTSRLNPPVVPILPIPCCLSLSFLSPCCLAPSYLGLLLPVSVPISSGPHLTCRHPACPCPHPILPVLSHLSPPACPHPGLDSMSHVPITLHIPHPQNSSMFLNPPSLPPSNLPHPKPKSPNPTTFLDSFPTPFLPSHGSPPCPLRCVSKQQWWDGAGGGDARGHPHPSPAGSNPTGSSQYWLHSPLWEGFYLAATQRHEVAVTIGMPQPVPMEQNKPPQRDLSAFPMGIQDKAQPEQGK